MPEAKAGKNRLHLDIKVALGLDGDARRTRIDAEADRLIALGATVTERFDTPEDVHLILQDPGDNVSMGLPKIPSIGLPKIPMGTTACRHLVR